jgi:UDP:flavonoid glycosyltransferase YjiC (YdhE family)
MAMIAFIPFPEIGHVNPTFKLAKGLQRRNHRVCYLGIRDYEEYVAAEGLDFVPILDQWCPRGFSKEPGKIGKIFALSAARDENRRGGNPLAEIRDVLRRTGPDLVVTDVHLRDLAFLADRLDIKSVLISPMIPIRFEQLLQYEPPASFRPPILILCPVEFEFPDASRVAGRHYIEASIDLGRKAVPFPWEQLDETRPLIYCSFGSHTHRYKQSAPFFQVLIDAVKRKPEYQLVLAVGAHLSPSEFGPAPSNVVLVNMAPQLKMLERASMMVTHGGLGSVKECIFLNVPMIVFPALWDQPDNAARIAYHGLGLCGNINHPSAQGISSMIDRVHHDQSFKARVVSMGEKFREIEKSERGVQLIESILGGAEATAAAQ